MNDKQLEELIFWLRLQREEHERRVEQFQTDRQRGFEEGMAAMCSIVLSRMGDK